MDIDDIEIVLLFYVLTHLPFLSQRLVNVLNFSYGLEKEAASMCSELRGDLLGACGVIDELKKSLVRGGERLEGEREGKMKSVMKYVQER